MAEKVETSTNYIAAIEAGRRFPSVEVLERIANALGIDTLELFSMESIHITSINGLYKEMIEEITQIIADHMEKRLKKLNSKQNVQNN